MCKFYYRIDVYVFFFGIFDVLINRIDFCFFIYIICLFLYGYFLFDY